jgi:hypothetical protein
MAIIYPACSCKVSNLSTHASWPVEPILKHFLPDAGQKVLEPQQGKKFCLGGGNSNKPVRLWDQEKATRDEAPEKSRVFKG